MWISLVFWATELDTSLSSSICQPASINKWSSGNRARYGFIEVDISTGLDELIDLGKQSSICRYRARIVEEGEARTPTFPGGQVEYYRFTLIVANRARSPRTSFLGGGGGRENCRALSHASLRKSWITDECLKFSLKLAKCGQTFNYLS